MTVHSEADARELVRFVLRQELAGINVIEAVRAARAPVVAATFPRLQDALSEWLDAQVNAGEIRASTARLHKSRCRTWLYPEVGERAIDTITREQIGAVILKLKAVGRSSSAIKRVVNPLKTYDTCTMPLVLPLPPPGPPTCMIAPYPSLGA